MRCSAARIESVDGMKVLLSPRSTARLAAASAACAVALTLAPVTASAATAHTHARHTLAADGLCDGHKWSLFGCRPDHHRPEQPDADDVRSAG